MYGGNPMNIELTSQFHNIPHTLVNFLENQILTVYISRRHGTSQIGFFSPKRNIFLRTCTTCSELPSYISVMSGEKL